ncbi:MAG: MFS transporter, partial [Tepidisphaeraceae bacterium]
LTSVALFGYAAASRWPAVVALGVLLGLGGGAIDAALNTYVATNHGPRTMNWLHACYGIGAATGPMIMTTVLGKGLSWQRGYAVVALAQLVLAGSFALTLRRWPRTSGAASQTSPDEAAPTVGATLGIAGARLGIATFFVYAGVEASFGAWTYTLLTAGRAASPLQAGAVVSVFWGSLTAGRLVTAFAGGLAPVRHLLTGAVWAVIGGAGLVWLNAGLTSTFAGVVLAGVACGPIFPTLVSVTPARLGATHAANGVGFQIAAAAIGLSIVPAFVGVIADTAGVETIATLFLLLSLLLGTVHWLLDKVAPVGETAATP